MMIWCRWIGVVVACVGWLGAFPLQANAKKGVGKWVVISKKGGVLVKRMKVHGSPLFAFRGEFTANIHIAKLVTVLANAKYRKRWVDRYHSSGNIEVPSKFERVYWIRFKFPWPAWDRDFVMYTRAVPDLKKRTFTALIKSIKHKKYPKQKGCIRAIAMRTFYQFKAITSKKGPPKTHIIVEVHTDPKGWLPAWLINSAQANWPRKTLRNLVKTAKKVGYYPLLKKWHDPKPLSYPPKLVKEFARLLKIRSY